MSAEAAAGPVPEADAKPTLFYQAMLLATVTAIAVNVSVFELPVIRDAMSGEDPAATIEQRLEDTRETGRLPGVLVGAGVFLLFAL